MSCFNYTLLLTGHKPPRHTTLHYTTLPHRYNTLHCTTLTPTPSNITVHTRITQCYPTKLFYTQRICYDEHYTLCMYTSVLHYTTMLHYTTLQCYATLHSNTFITLELPTSTTIIRLMHYTTLYYTTLHCVTRTTLHALVWCGVQCVWCSTTPHNTTLHRW